MSKVLIVDDSALIRGQVTRALSSAGFTTVEAADGVDGLQKLASNDDVALIVCDVNMPKMSGLELLEHLEPQQRLIPIVMLTTEGQPELMVRARELGAKAWLRKPFNADLLVAAAKKLAAQASRTSP